MKYLVKFLIPDMPPPRGLKRMQYYTESEGDSEILHLGTSPQPIRIELLRTMVGNGSLIELPHPVLLSGMQDVWLGENGDVFVADAVAPFTDKRQVFKI